MKKSFLVVSIATLSLVGIVSAQEPSSLRGGTYNDINEAAASDNSVDNLTDRPYLANGQKIFYFEPGTVDNRQTGVITIADGSKTWYAHGSRAWHTDILNTGGISDFGNDDLATLNFGLASGNWGASLFFGSSKQYVYSKTTESAGGSEQLDSSATFKGDQIGVGFGLISGAGEFFGNLKIPKYWR